MAIIVCTGAVGAPGVTTTALGLALTWPRDVLLADCDREPSQAIQAGYLRGMDHGGRGLVTLARLYREERALAPDLWQHTLPLVQFGDVQRRFLPGFTQPGVVRIFDHVWPELVNAFALLDGQGVDVIVDAGRVDRTGLPLALLEGADAVAFVSRSSLRALAASRLYLPIVAEQVAQLPTDRAMGLVIVGPGRPYATAEIAAQFGVPCWAEIDWSPAQAAVLSDGEEEPRRFRSGSLLSGYRKVALQLHQRILRSRAMAASMTARPAS